ncbi:hypothetical protein PKHYL_16890 [Psychrobacter sp. KH172YL61]|nr:hypothetical protein PKHYL_16890 [Psychrobacter sp. KH172YL61]
MTSEAYRTAAGQDFIKAMNDDFNSSTAISVLFGLARDINKAIKAEEVETAWQLAQQLKALAQVLNILQQPVQQFCKR